MIRKGTFVVVFVMIIMVTTLVETTDSVAKTEVEESNIVTTTNYTTSITTTLPNTTPTQTTTQHKIQPKQNISTTNKTTTSKVTTTAIATVNTKTSLGIFKITVYCPSSDGGKWGYATSTGVKSSHLKTCAVDPSVIPLGSTIKVNGLVLDAVDTGSAVKGNIIDIFYDGTKDEAMSWIADFGTSHEVFTIE